MACICQHARLPIPDRWRLRVLNPKLFDELGTKLSELAAASPAKDLEKNVRALLGSVFARLELVTREEFDVQCEVLAKARERLAVLEARIAELEKRAPAA